MPIDTLFCLCYHINNTAFRYRNLTKENDMDPQEAIRAIREARDGVDDEVKAEYIRHIIDGNRPDLVLERYQDEVLRKSFELRRMTSS
jgi:hypothetical protein